MFFSPKPHILNALYPNLWGVCESFNYFTKFKQITLDLIAFVFIKYTNIKSLTTKAKKDKVTIKKGKTFKLGVKVKKASLKLKTKNYRKTAYETSNKKIATVTSKGVIKAKKKGTCYVYVYTQNGIFKKIKVTVKK